MISINKIRLLPFFHSFEDAQLKAIIDHFMSKSYQVGEIILQEKKINTRLLFLVSGTVEILINNQVVVELSQIGEVFGEMSLANHSTCTATVRAKTPCEFLIVSFEDMRKSLAPEIKDGVLKNFYKGAMEILANKLVQTNKRSF